MLRVMFLYLKCNKIRGRNFIKKLISNIYIYIYHTVNPTHDDTCQMTGGYVSDINSVWVSGSYQSLSLRNFFSPIFNKL